MNESETQKDETTHTVPEVVEAEMSTNTEDEVLEPAVVVETETKEEVTVSAPAVTSETAATTAEISSMLSKLKSFLKTKKYIIATVAAVLIALLALVYVLEDQGKLTTGFFAGLQEQVSKHTAAAKVNSDKISKYDLEISMTQLSSGAAAQGADVADPAVQTEIRTQALDMLINTELLKQEANSRGITVTEEEITTRLETLKTDVGGEEVLNQRMVEFGINQKTLLRDIKNELTIKKLLDEIFKEKSITITDEEILAFYDESGGVNAGLPALEEVKEQIEAQLKATKEQGVVTTYIEELRGKAEIEILI